MRIEAMNPVTGLDWKADRRRVCGAWSMADWQSNIGAYRKVRQVRHYGTLMMEFVKYGDNPWEVHHLAVGRGSVSDQGGCNKVLRAMGSKWEYRRDARGGGARFVYDGVEVW